MFMTRVFAMIRLFPLITILLSPQAAMSTTSSIKFYFKKTSSAFWVPVPPDHRQQRRRRNSIVHDSLIHSSGNSNCHFNRQHHRRVTQRQNSLDASSNDENIKNDEFESFDTNADDAEETLLRINFSFPTQEREIDFLKGEKALEAVQTYTKSFPFVAVLPVQAMTYFPIQTTNGDLAVKVTFLRKKTAEKGSMDGGILFSCRLAKEEGCGEDDPADADSSVGDDSSPPMTSQTNDNQRQRIHLVAQRISKGQTVSKVFSEKQLIMAFVKGLSEVRGKEILVKGGDVEVDSIFHLWM